MKLLLIRHAPAIARGTPGVADGERPLTAAGEAEFRSAAGGLAWIVDPPDVLLSSPLVRARATARIATQAFGHLEPRIEPALAEGSPEMILAALAAHGKSATTIGVVGHEPLLAAVLARLLGSPDSDRMELEKGGAALVDLPAGLSGGARLVWFLGPRILGTLGGRRESAEEARTRTGHRVGEERTLRDVLAGMVPTRLYLLRGVPRDLQRAARGRAQEEGTTLRWLLLGALRDYAAGTWRPRRDARAPEVV